MEKQNYRWIVAALFLAGTLAVIASVWLSLRRSTRVILPDTQSTTGTESPENWKEGDGLSVISLTPGTVQAAVKTLLRPDSYCRTVTVTQSWNGGSNTYRAHVTVSQPWTRVDLDTPDGRVRHSITDGKITYIWYDEETAFYQVPSGTITADHEQNIPTYEDLLHIPVKSILLAEHQVFSGLNCIYVETEEEGTVDRWWISLDSGLLVAAERLHDETVIYHMEALTIDSRSPSALDFILPDGAVLAELP